MRASPLFPLSPAPVQGDDEGDVFGSLPIEEAPKEIEELVLASPCKKQGTHVTVDLSVVEDVKL